MKTETNRTLGFTVSYQVPESYDEYDRMTGTPGSALSDAIANVTYRQWNHEFRARFCEALEDHTGVEREFELKEPKKEGEEPKKVYIQSEQAFVSDLLGSSISEEEAQQIANKIAAEVAFDPTPKKRAKKVPQEVTNVANDILRDIDSGETSVDRVKDNFCKCLEIEDFDAVYGEELTVESLCRAIQADIEKEAQKRKSKYS